jgi:DNA-binding transcriptional ArsR family regulator
MSKRLKPGDILLLNMASGVAYLQYVGRHAVYGDAWLPHGGATWCGRCELAGTCTPRGGSFRGIRRSNSFTVSNLMMRELGVHPDAKTRALRVLEGAGLIAIESRGKRSPRVTLIVEECAFYQRDETCMYDTSKLNCKKRQEAWTLYCEG